MQRGIVIALISILLSGCGTFASRDPFFRKPGIYPATRFDVEGMRELESPYPVFLALDMPISLVTDTLLIPYDLLR
ncbi:YceK/YidQ family lipoprotein [Cedecea davisae]|uniref:YceK/YidQ family lipoprotein n=1 Tax=Cedecea davisae TaxID=158484 RepID=UPI001D0A7866|nr:YceK/YidQ family lipoprotein [Cedecea davisae]